MKLEHCLTCAPEPHLYRTCTCRWIQTSTDVSVMLALPPGTRAADLRVSAAGGRLTVGLRWFGTVLDGKLHRPVKASDTHWCIEGEEVRSGGGEWATR